MGRELHPKRGKVTIDVGLVRFIFDHFSYLPTPFEQISDSGFKRFGIFNGMRLCIFCVSQVQH